MPAQAALTTDLLSSYIARKQNPALEAIADASPLNQYVLASYAKANYVPTEKKVRLADSERLCLAQAIYHEARGESEDGQWAVANVIINRAFSKKYPSTICGVVCKIAPKVDPGASRQQVHDFACKFTTSEGSSSAPILTPLLFQIV